MILFETKFYFFLGKKDFSKCRSLLDRYLQKNGETYKYSECCVNYYYETNDFETAFNFFKRCIEIRKIKKSFEEWGTVFFIEENVKKGEYQLAARNAMALADLENLNDNNRMRILKILDYIKNYL